MIQTAEIGLAQSIARYRRQPQSVHLGSRWSRKDVSAFEDVLCGALEAKDIEGLIVHSDCKASARAPAAFEPQKQALVVSKHIRAVAVRRIYFSPNDSGDKQEQLFDGLVRQAAAAESGRPSCSSTNAGARILSLLKTGEPVFLFPFLLQKSTVVGHGRDVLRIKRGSETLIVLTQNFHHVISLLPLIAHLSMVHRTPLPLTILP